MIVRTPWWSFLEYKYQRELHRALKRTSGFLTAQPSSTSVDIEASRPASRSSMHDGFNASMRDGKVTVIPIKLKRLSRKEVECS